VNDKKGRKLSFQLFSIETSLSNNYTIVAHRQQFTDIRSKDKDLLTDQVSKCGALRGACRRTCAEQNFAPESAINPNSPNQFLHHSAIGELFNSLLRCHLKDALIAFKDMLTRKGPKDL